MKKIFRIKNWQIEQIIRMRMKKYSLEEISKKTEVPIKEIKILLKLK
jgi:hypothetical protein